MDKENQEKFIEKAKSEYHKIGSVSCPAFDNDLIYFNKYGFKHLIRKGRKYREQDEQIWRLRLLPYAVVVLRNAKNIYRYKEDDNGKAKAYFWEFRAQVNIVYRKITLCIILRKLGNGKLHFFSVFDK